MENAFRWSLALLYDANAELCRDSAAGRDRQHTFLEVPAVLNSPAVRRALLPSSKKDPFMARWWREYDELVVTWGIRPRLAELLDG